MLATLEISKVAITQRLAAMRKYPLKAILGEAVSAVMDAKAGKMLEYRRLHNAKPRYKRRMGLLVLQ